MTWGEALDPHVSSSWDPCCMRVGKPPSMSPWPHFGPLWQFNCSFWPKCFPKTKIPWKPNLPTVAATAKQYGSSNNNEAWHWNGIVESRIGASYSCGQRWWVIGEHWRVHDLLWWMADSWLSLCNKVFRNWKMKWHVLALSVGTGPRKNLRKMCLKKSCPKKNC